MLADVKTVSSKEDKSTFLRHGFYLFCRSLFSVYCTHKVYGYENLPRSVPFMICSNHCSHMDAPALMLATRRHFDHFSLLAAQDYFFSPEQKNHFTAKLMQLTPVSREASLSHLRASIHLCKQHIAQGRNLIMYPEGTRSETGELQELKRGAAFIARRCQVLIVPAYVEGSFASLPKGKRFIRPKKITVAFAPVIDPCAQSDADTIKLLQQSILELKHQNK